MSHSRPYSCPCGNGPWWQKSEEDNQELTNVSVRDESGCSAFTTTVFNSNSLRYWYDGVGSGNEVSEFCGVVWTNGGTVLHAHHSHVKSEQLLAGWLSFRPIGSSQSRKGSDTREERQVHWKSKSTVIPRQFRNSGGSTSQTLETKRIWQISSVARSINASPKA